MIICMEGGDAVGKQTQSKLLAEALQAQRFTFPDYETLSGKTILSNLKNEWGAAKKRVQQSPLDETFTDYYGDKDINALVLQSLMLTNRMELGAAMLVASIKGHVILDRYSASSFVYGKIDGLDIDFLERANDALPVQPDINLLLDAPVEEGFARRPERRDRYETDREFLGKVRIGYLELFKERQSQRAEKLRQMGELDPTHRRSFDLGSRWEVIDAVGTVEEVRQRIWSAVGGWSLETYTIKVDNS